MLQHAPSHAATVDAIVALVTQTNQRLVGKRVRRILAAQYVQEEGVVGLATVMAQAEFEATEQNAVKRSRSTSALPAAIISQWCRQLMAALATAAQRADLLVDLARVPRQIFSAAASDTDSKKIRQKRGDLLARMVSALSGADPQWHSPVDLSNPQQLQLSPRRAPHPAVSAETPPTPTSSPPAGESAMRAGLGQLLMSSPRTRHVAVVAVLKHAALWKAVMGHQLDNDPGRCLGKAFAKLKARFGISRASWQASRPAAVARKSKIPLLNVPAAW